MYEWLESFSTPLEEKSFYSATKTCFVFGAVVMHAFMNSGDFLRFLRVQSWLVVPLSSVKKRPSSSSSDRKQKFKFFSKRNNGVLSVFCSRILMRSEQHFIYLLLTPSRRIGEIIIIIIVLTQ